MRSIPFVHVRMHKEKFNEILRLAIAVRLETQSVDDLVQNFEMESHLLPSAQQAALCCTASIALIFLLVYGGSTLVQHTLTLDVQKTCNIPKVNGAISFNAQQLQQLLCKHDLSYIILHNTKSSFTDHAATQKFTLLNFHDNFLCLESFLQHNLYFGTTCIRVRMQVTLLL